jgi:hypothetical protein
MIPVDTPKDQGQTLHPSNQSTEHTSHSDITHHSNWPPPHGLTSLPTTGLAFNPSWIVGSPLLRAVPLQESTSIFNLDLTHQNHTHHQRVSTGPRCSSQISAHTHTTSPPLTAEYHHQYPICQANNITMPPRHTTLRKRNQPRPPTPGTAMLKTPPENAGMTGPTQALTIRLNPPSPHKALYPPWRQHPSDSAVQRYHTAKATASWSGSAPCSPCKQHCTTKLPVSCSRSAGRFTSEIPHQGRSPTPSKMVYSIFHPAPSTASTSSLTQGSSLSPGLIEGSSMNSSLNNPSTLSTRKSLLHS